jgi:transcription antitermination protein NusB
MPVATRRAARERALGLAYESELRGLRALALISEQPVEPDEYACRIVAGADDHRDEIDALIRKFSEHWSLERMPVIDRALLRLGTYELAWEPGTPTGAIITEAVELAKQYSTKDSGRFVNGLLARIAEDVRPDDVSPDDVNAGDVDAHDVGPQDVGGQDVGRQE